MIYPFFALAAQSPSRQEAFRSAVLTHLVVAAGCAWYICAYGPGGMVVVGHVLLIMGIIEGAVLIGWRLTQLPKSIALEFLLVSQLSARNLFLAEALVGISRLALVTLAGLPVLLFLTTVTGHNPSAGYDPVAPRLILADLPLLLGMPFTWGLVTGLGLTAWAYETRTTRRLGERLTLLAIIVYLVVGVMAGEKLLTWLSFLPSEYGDTLKWIFISIHTNTPFALMHAWFSDHPGSFVDNVLLVQIGAVAAVGFAITRSAARLKGHFDDLHYRPAVDRSRGPRGVPGDRPLAWWAVRRVSEYSGRINLWLAAGFGVVYAAYTLAGDAWPAWMGRGVFQIVEQIGGIPGVATGLVVLGAVPAAFQYGLWDSNTQDRCRRLELLLLTELEATDYWDAAALAAWRRGRGYILVALLLVVAAVLGGKIGVVDLLVAVASAVILWSLYFVLGFRAFTRGVQANSSGMLLTVGLPLITYVLFRMGWPAVAAILPPGMVYGPLVNLGPLYWLAGPTFAAIIVLRVARRSLASCDQELRRWYERYHGQKVID